MLVLAQILVDSGRVEVVDVVSVAPGILTMARSPGARYSVEITQVN